jgi:hypothetical protein
MQLEIQLPYDHGHGDPFYIIADKRREMMHQPVTIYFNVESSSIISCIYACRPVTNVLDLLELGISRIAGKVWA